MASRRGADTPDPARRRPAQTALSLPPADAPYSATDLLLRSWPGRLFIVSASIRVLVALVRMLGQPPAFIEVLGTTAAIGLVVALSYFVARLFVLIKRRLLWRVRRKLILSYIFIGFVPALLIIGFFLIGSGFVSQSVSAYLFRDGYDDVERNATLVTEAAAAEITRTPATLRETIERVHRNGVRALGYKDLSIAFVPAAAGQPTITAGLWGHAAVPAEMPTWVRDSRDGVTRLVAVTRSDSPGEAELVVRAVRPTGRTAVLGWVVTDVPLDGAMLDRLAEMTGVKAGAITIGSAADTDGVLVVRSLGAGSDGANRFSLFGRSVTFFDSADWHTGATRRATIAVTYSLGELYRRLSLAQSAQLYGDMTLGEAVLLILMVVAVLFLVIEIVALVMGLALARSITSSIHEIFMGTERVRQGDFTHRIDIRTKDQLGELAQSFNQMTGSIENLLQTAAEKKRLEEELRIARQIQMSLLPRGPLDIPGLGVTALCVPAREVGGDYYDFFPLGHERVGVLIADVSGKGTSAALYMAELKGLVLSLSQIYQSPRQLLLEVNRIISENLDSRSFITMTYAVLDLSKGLMTYARAGHTPLIFMGASKTAGPHAQVLTPSGMVLGLRIDGAAEKFAELLEEEQVPLHNGDVIVLYTDGITEAMDVNSDLFGEARLSRIVEEHGHLDSGELRERILREIEAFVGGADQHDDMTMILIKVERAAAARVAV